VLCTWQTNIINFTEFHSLSTCPSSLFLKSFSIFGAGITQFGMVTGEELDGQPIRLWILAEARDLSILIALDSSWGSFPGRKGY
jgi:hypothetical protein